MKAWVQVLESSKSTGHCPGRARQGKAEGYWLYRSWWAPREKREPIQKEDASEDGAADCPLAYLCTCRHTNIHTEAFKNMKGPGSGTVLNHSTREAEASGSLWPGHQQVYKANSRTARGTGETLSWKRTTTKWGGWDGPALAVFAALPLAPSTHTGQLTTVCNSRSTEFISLFWPS